MALRRDLEFPLVSLRPFQRPGVVVLLMSDILEPHELRLSLWDRISSQGGAVANIVFASMEPMKIAFRSGTEFDAAIHSDHRNGFALSSDCYLDISSASVCGYNSARDNFGVLAIPEPFLMPGEVIDWDRSFSEHNKVIGVGFGDAGQSYLRGLLADIEYPRRQALTASVRQD